ncbi:hypothetical protein O9K51_05001 [Purpureocillium lavendulum]|uniref:Uncharacterized protein n=1 Tax=Purpureocillium lavendulum TaxID=1247861 RepID=A0AB34FTQ1_9HYPO|nr:hypothetical protein O9K51_05001 [Purpureocillium lavendulum]
MIASRLYAAVAAAGAAAAVGQGFSLGTMSNNWRHYWRIQCPSNVAQDWLTNRGCTESYGSCSDSGAYVNYSDTRESCNGCRCISRPPYVATGTARVKWADQTPVPRGGGGDDDDDGQSQHKGNKKKKDVGESKEKYVSFYGR